MSRSNVHLQFDRDLLVILMYRASVNRRNLNEECEELLYSAVRADEEAAGESETLAYLDEVYGQIHGYWEASKPQRDDPAPLPY